MFTTNDVLERLTTRAKSCDNATDLLIMVERIAEPGDGENGWCDDCKKPGVFVAAAALLLLEVELTGQSLTTRQVSHRMGMLARDAEAFIATTYLAECARERNDDGTPVALGKGEMCFSPWSSAKQLAFGTNGEITTYLCSAQDNGVNKSAYL